MTPLVIDSKIGHVIDPSTVKDGMVIVDAGASYGEFVDAFSERFDAKPLLWCFEPSQHSRAVFMERHPKVTCAPMAIVGLTEGDPVVFTEIVGKGGKYHQWGNIYGTTRGLKNDAAKVRQYDVPTIGINDLNSFIDAPHIDYLKLDVEGSELEILVSMTPETAEKITQISLEWHDKLEVPKIKDALTRLGFNDIHGFPHEIYARRKHAH